jgi:rubredoxin
MATITEIKKQIEDARAKYQEIVHSAPAPEVKAASDVVKALQQQLSDAICEGAKPCPDCGAPPHGMEQPRLGGGGFEFEIGCTICGWFFIDENTARDRSARGGPLPRHAVEAWNEGPDYWRTKSRDKFVADHGAERWESLKPRTPMNRFVVESRLEGQGGAPDATARVFVATQARAEEITAAGPGRTWRPLTDEELGQLRAARARTGG